MDFANHPAENPVIRIRTGDVMINLMEHTLGRGRWVTQHGGIGIGITTEEPDDDAAAVGPAAVAARRGCGLGLGGGSRGAADALVSRWHCRGRNQAASARLQFWLCQGGHHAACG